MRFGGLVAVDDLSFTAYQREITAIIGPNGAGKTTVFNCLTGFYKPTVGPADPAWRRRRSLLLERMDGFRIAQRAGMARTFQNIRLFAGMTRAREPDRRAAQPADAGVRLHRSPACSACRATAAPSAQAVELRRATGSTGIGLTDARRLDGRHPALRRPAPARDRPRDVHPAAPAVPRRAGRRPQPARDRPSSTQLLLGDPRRAGRSASC